MYRQMVGSLIARIQVHVDEAMHGAIRIPGARQSRYSRRTGRTIGGRRSRFYGLQTGVVIGRWVGEAEWAGVVRRERGSEWALIPRQRRHRAIPRITRIAGDAGGPMSTGEVIGGALIAVLELDHVGVVHLGRESSKVAEVKPAAQVHIEARGRGEARVHVRNQFVRGIAGGHAVHIGVRFYGCARRSIGGGVGALRRLRRLSTNEGDEVRAEAAG